MRKPQVLQTKLFLGLQQPHKAPSFHFQWVLMSGVWYTEHHWGNLCRSLQWPEWGAEFRVTVKSWIHTLTWNMILSADIQPGNTFFIEPHIKSSLISFVCSYSQCCTECFGCMCRANNCIPRAIQIWHTPHWSDFTLHKCLTIIINKLEHNCFSSLLKSMEFIPEWIWFLNWKERNSSQDITVAICSLPDCKHMWHLTRSL